MRKVLIANRGEIACRLLLACRQLGLATVAVYATPDADAPHVALADEAYELPGERPAETYLDGDLLLAIARTSGADTIHPGYGLLSEAAEFAAAVEDAGLTFVGPAPAAIALMGHKHQARQVAKAAGVPVLPGALLGPDDWPSTYPVMIKAVGGGGGLGLRRVERAADLEAAMESAREQCAASFSSRGAVQPADVDLYWEQYLPGARHIEVQIVADRHGAIGNLGLRECSVQRRFQKLVEECPAPGLDAATIRTLGELAERVAASVGYTNLGTVEFLWTPSGGPVFLEMNTRLQVEHPVTELVSGLDLPQLQLALAAGESLATALAAWSPRGHAIEARLYAEDPGSGAPGAGRIDHLVWPAGPWVRVDAGVQAGQMLPTTFDALLAKVIAWGPTREVARARLADALARVEIAGTLITNLAQLRAILAAPAFIAGELHTAFLAGTVAPLQASDAREAAQLAALALAPGPAKEPRPEREQNSWARRAWRT